MKKGVLLLLTAVGLVACSKNTPGAMDDQPAAVTVMSVPVSGFSGGQQTISGLENGVYSLQFFAKSDGKGYITAGDRMTALTASFGVQTEGFVRGIEVSGGSMTISLKDADVSQFSNIRLVKTDKTYSLLKGGDISELSYVKREGGKYFDADGSAVEMPKFLANNGMNLVRIRLYNEPGKYQYNGYSLPEGIQDESDCLALAKRAKAAGMQILLTFHYSDYWTNGADQYIPHAWESMDAEQMKQALYDFTYSFMEKMKAQGTMPEYVSLGNETQAGMLYPMGGPLISSDADYYNKVQNLVAFYNAGYEAVKTSAPDAKVIIHLNDAGNKDAYNWYFGLMKDNGAKYDIIGASYYPYWTSRWAKDVCEWAEYVTDKFDKDLIFMETAYAWQQKIHNNVTDGQLSHNWPYTDMSQTGQQNFILELTNEIKKVSNQRVLGYVYWDPIFIPAGNAGWAVGEPNAVSNAALFDFEGKALSVWNAFRWNN